MFSREKKVIYISMINKRLYKFKIIKDNILMNKIIVYHGKQYNNMKNN